MALVCFTVILSTKLNAKTNENIVESKEINQVSNIIFKYQDSFGNSISEDEKIFGNVGEKIELTNYIKTFENYKYIGNYENIQIEESDKDIILKYSKLTDYKINYLDTQGNIIKESIDGKSYIGEQIEITPTEIEGYKYVLGLENIIDVENKEINLIYKKVEKKKVTTMNKKNDEKKIEIPKKTINIYYKDFNTNNIILRDSIIVDENVHKIRYKLKKVEGYRPMDEEDKSIINEIINELSGGEENKDKNVKSEYEIIMNCDNSDYIIYFKK